MKKCLFFALVCALAACSKPGNEPREEPREYAIITKGTHGTATATVDGKTVTKATANTVVTLTAAPDNDYLFTGWEATGITLTGVSPTTFTMPAGDVTITGLFAHRPYTITVAGEHGTVTATVEGVPVTQAEEKAVVTLTAEPDAGYLFTGWTATGIELADPVANPAAFEMPAADVAFEADFFGYTVAEAEAVINGITWAACNVDAPGTFAAAPGNYGMFYQWGRLLGWSSTNPLADSDGGTTWNTGVYSGANDWTAESDPCPTGWRVPTSDEQGKLFDADAVLSVWATLSDVAGRLLIDRTTGDAVFMPAPGFRDYSAGVILYAGTQGFYWASDSQDSKYSYRMFLAEGKVNYRLALGRNNGISVRCVRR